MSLTLLEPMLPRNDRDIPEEELGDEISTSTVTFFVSGWKQNTKTKQTLFLVTLF